MATDRFVFKLKLARRDEGNASTSTIKQECRRYALDGSLERTAVYEVSTVTLSI